MHESRESCEAYDFRALFWPRFYNLPLAHDFNGHLITSLGNSVFGTPVQREK